MTKPHCPHTTLGYCNLCLLDMRDREELLLTLADDGVRVKKATAENLTTHQLRAMVAVVRPKSPLQGTTDRRIIELALKQALRDGEEQAAAALKTRLERMRAEDSSELGE
ncbi:hypothetical protein RKD49_005393 [Streptomyces glaucescens]|jgi:hypothetical protein